MITAWFAKLWAKIGFWLGLVGAVVVAVFAALAYGEHKGKQVGVADAAKQAVADAKATQAEVTNAARVRANVETATDKLSDAPAQKVADAKPGTAAGELRKDGWTRD